MVTYLRRSVSADSWFAAGRATGWSYRVTIDDPEFVAASGKRHHAIVRFNGRSERRVSGMVFELSDSELAGADAYEPAGYTRVPATLASGKQAWVYAGARCV